MLQSFGVQESQEDNQPLHLAPSWEHFIPIFPEELRNHLLASLAKLDLTARERGLSGCLVESWVSGLAIHLRIGLTDEEGDALMGVLGVDEMEWIHGRD